MNLTDTMLSEKGQTQKGVYTEWFSLCAFQEHSTQLMGTEVRVVVIFGCSDWERTWGNLWACWRYSPSLFWITMYITLYIVCMWENVLVSTLKSNVLNAMYFWISRYILTYIYIFILREYMWGGKGQRKRRESHACQNRKHQHFENKITISILRII